MTSDAHLEMLRELVNIGFGRAASALSDLTGQHVLLDVPDVTTVPASELGSVFHGLIPGRVAAVHQGLQGRFEGDALLVLGHESAMALSDLLTKAHNRSHGLDESDNEVLSEVGNILLNAFVGSFGNLLQSRLLLSVPALFVDKMETLFEGVLKRQPAALALVVTTTFRILQESVSGYVVMIFTLEAMEHLAAALDGLS